VISRTDQLVQAEDATKEDLVVAYKECLACHEVILSLDFVEPPSPEIGS